MTTILATFCFALGFLGSFLISFIRSLFQAPVQTIAAAQAVVAWSVGIFLNGVFVVGSTAVAVIQVPFWYGVLVVARVRAWANRLNIWAKVESTSISEWVAAHPDPAPAVAVVSDGSNAVE
jgi:hypothetical protein